MNTFGDLVLVDFDPFGDRSRKDSCCILFFVGSDWSEAHPVFHLCIKVLKVFKVGLSKRIKENLQL